jgi:polyisoprenyl-teichoic acid--peptidoglycan teichoic acid transferase
MAPPRTDPPVGPASTWDRDPPGPVRPPGPPGPSPPHAPFDGPGPPTPPLRPVARSRRGRRRALIALAIGLAGVLALGALAVAYTSWRLGQIHRIAVDGLVPAGSGAPQTILLAGSDSRAGESAAAAQHFGSAAQVTGQRSDVLILLHLDPAAGRVSMLSIPRDLFVPIAGTGSSNRINVAIGQNPGLLVRTIEQSLGITINHYAQENFTGLQGLTNAVGGVCMAFPYPARDGSPTGQGNESGLDIPTAGRHVLHGDMALALVRSRYYQYFANGAWHAEGTGDIGRMQRQHDYARALVAKALHLSLRNPFTANTVLSKAVKDISVDSSFTDIGMLRLATHFRSLHPTSIPSWTLPYVAANNYKGYGDVLIPQPGQDTQVIAQWQSYGSAAAAPASAPISAPSSVTVRVLNGSGRAGEAARAAESLRTAGFQIGGYGTGSVLGRTETVIAYPPGRAADARTVAAHVGGPVSLTAEDGLGAATVVVTTGTGFTGVVAAAPTSGASPTGGSPTPSAGAGPATPAWDPRPCE